MINSLFITLLIPYFLFAAFDFRNIRYPEGIFVASEPAFPGTKTPYFTIKDSADIEKVINVLKPFSSLNIDQSLFKQSDYKAECNHLPQVGYPPELAYPTFFIPTYAHPSFVIGNQTVAFKDGAPGSCRYMWDRNSQVERLIIKILSKDSAFNPVAIKPNKDGLTVKWFAVDKTVEFKVMDMKGNITTSFHFSGMLGGAFLNFDKLPLKKEKYILKSNLSNKTNAFTLPQ